MASQKFEKSFSVDQDEKSSSFLVKQTLLKVIIMLNAALKLCYIRLTFTGLMSTTNCSKLSQQLRDVCSHARNNKGINIYF